jgi:hypothetical protein
MRNVKDKSRENENAHFVFSNIYGNHAVYDIRLGNIVELGRPQMTIWCMYIACRIPKATNTLRICNT